MKIFIKYFFVSFLLFTVVFTGVMWAYDGFFEEAPSDRDDEGRLITTNPLDANAVEAEPGSFEYMFSHSNRTNVLLLGMEGARTDTIMVASFDPDSKKINLISIPRDTYYPRDDHHSADKKKMNSVYYDEGVAGCEAAVSDILLGMPIHYYVKVKYNGVEKVVDSLGGIPVYVPMNMEYDDIYDSPPLHIRLSKGQQTLGGKKAIQFLRFRKNNDGTGYPNGDIGRIKAQQDFMKAAFKKTLSHRLPIVANTVMKYVKTDIPLTEVMSMATSAVGMSSEDLSTYSLPGEAVYSEGLSFYLTNVEETAAMIESIYETNAVENREEE